MGMLCLIFVPKAVYVRQIEQGKRQERSSVVVTFGERASGVPSGTLARDDESCTDDDPSSFGGEGLRIIEHPKNEELYKEEIVRLREELRVASSRNLLVSASVRERHPAEEFDITSL